MALADDLLDQAELLTRIDTRKPRQANLRRAISAAYYALFHLLVSEASQRVSPATPPTLAPRIARAIAHAEMRDVCLNLSKANQNGMMTRLLPEGPSERLKYLSKSFVELQDARHEADYDIEAFYNRSDAAEVVFQARAAFDAWQAIRLTDEANVFLAALLFARRWSK